MFIKRVVFSSFIVAVIFFATLPVMATGSVTTRTTPTESSGLTGPNEDLKLEIIFVEANYILRLASKEENSLKIYYLSFPIRRMIYIHFFCVETTSDWIFEMS